MTWIFPRTSLSRALPFAANNVDLTSCFFVARSPLDYELRDSVGKLTMVTQWEIRWRLTTQETVGSHI